MPWQGGTEADMETNPDTERPGKNPFSKLDWPSPAVLSLARQARAEFLRQLAVTGWTNSVRFFSRKMNQDVASPSARR